MTRDHSPSGRRNAGRVVRTIAGGTLLVALGGCAGGESFAGQPTVVTELVTLLVERPELREALAAGIEAAAVPEIEDVDAFTDYVGALVTWIPVEREAVPRVLRIHHVVNHAPDDALNRDDDFAEWMSGLAEAWGAFLDSPASAAGIESFASYHRYHVPVGGVVREVRNLHGRVYIDVVKNEDGSFSGVNGDTYQFNQERGMVVIESPEVGLVALVPVGMSLISSVVLEPAVGDELRKGEVRSALSA